MKLEQMKGIRLKLITLSVVLILITALPIGLIFDNTVQSALLKSYINTSTEQLKTINEATKIFQGAIDKDITMFATDPLILKSDDSLTKYLDNTDEKKVMTPSKNGSIEQDIYKAFDHYGKIHPRILYTYMGTETGGYIQWPETSNSSKYDPRVRPWYTAAMKGGDKVSRTDPYNESVTGNMVVSNAMPIKTVDGKVIGVMGMDVSTWEITEIVNSIKIGETGYCMIVHKSGLVLADPSNPKNNSKYLKDIGIEGLEKVTAIDGDQFEVRINNEIFFVTSLKSTDSDWIIVSLITTSELYKTSAQIRQIILFVCLGTLLVGFIITFIASGKIVKPIISISNIAQSIANGNFMVKVQKFGSKDEIGILENSIGHMVENLQKMMGELENKNSLLVKEITEREHAQITLALSEEKYSKAFRYATDVICILKLSTEIFIEASDAFFSVFGYSPVEVIGHSSDELGLWCLPEERKKLFEMLTAGQLVRNYEAHWQTKTGLQRLGLCSIEEIDISGQRYLLSVWHDITEAKQAEEALLRAKDDLEMKVEMRTQELTAANQELLAMNEEVMHTLHELQQTQEQLIQSGKMASLGRLVAGVAHEVNTPIGVCVMAASYLSEVSQKIFKMYHDGVLARYDLEDYLLETEKSMCILTANLARAANLINSFKKVSVDQSSEKKRLFIVGEYLWEIILTLHPKFKKTKIEILVEGDEELEIYGHAGAFAQIITNLLENSLVHAYDKEQRGRISITFCVTDKNDFHLIYTDDGKGMSHHIIEHIFEPFFTTKRSQGGAGLGMHITYNIVTQKFRGMIECSSIEGENSTFSITFPIKQESDL